MTFFHKKPIFKGLCNIIFYVSLYLFGAASALANGHEPTAFLQRPLVETILTESAGKTSQGERITHISSYFLNTPYLRETLLGGPDETEQLVLRLDGFDCFTFLDTVEALRRSTEPGEFPGQMRQVRYRGGAVSYESRRHFFSDWVADQDTPIRDVTAWIAEGREHSVRKQLNARGGQDLWLQKIEVVPRRIAFIPAAELTPQILDRLQAGDYIGVYSPEPGLDVSHTGLIVKADGKTLLRHASSRSGVERVTDDDLETYLCGKAGVIVYRVMQ